jgi:hypothetical protein
MFKIPEKKKQIALKEIRKIRIMLKSIKGYEVKKYGRCCISN